MQNELVLQAGSIPAGKVGHAGFPNRDVGERGVARRLVIDLSPSKHRNQGRVCDESVMDGGAKR